MENRRSRETPEARRDTHKRQLPLSVLYWRLDRSSGYADTRLSDPSRRIILFCADGYSSSLAAATLRDLGFDRATDIVGGFNGWVADGLPVEH
jgi:rhodanese-related sulfurtransferase